MFFKDKPTIFLIILAFILVAGGIWYTQKPAPETPLVVDDNQEQIVDKTDDGLSGGEVDMSNWKTYRNEKVGFTMKYPSNWDFSEGMFAPKETIDWLKSINWAVSARAGRAIDVYFNDKVDSFESNESQAVTSTNIKINGIQSIQYHITSLQDSYGFPSGDEMTITIIPIKGGSVSLTLWGKKFAAIHNKLLSSIEID